MTDSPAPLRRDVLVALGIWVIVAVLVLVAIAVSNNSWRIWNTAAFCGSYADFHEPPVPGVCVSFPEYFRLSLTHPPFIIPAIVIGGITATGYVLKRQSIGDWM